MEDDWGRDNDPEVSRRHQKASDVYTEDRAEVVAQKATELLKTLIKSDANPQELRASAKSVDKGMNLGRERERSCPLANIIYQLSGALDISMGWLIEKERKRRSETMQTRSERKETSNLKIAKIELTEEGDDLFEVSDNSDEDSKFSSGISVESENYGKRIKGITDNKKTSSHNGTDSGNTPGAWSDDEDSDSFESSQTIRRKDHSNEQKSQASRAKNPCRKEYGKKLRDKYAATGRFRCDVCGFCSTSKGNLKHHKRIHIEKEEEKKPFPCKECGKRFYTSNHLKRHSSIHSDDENERLPFKCDDCGRRFTSRGNLSRHSRIHLPDDHPLKKANCNVCGKLIAPENMNEHKRTHLGNDDPDKKKQKCDICGKKFAGNLYALSVHKLTHLVVEEEKKPHKCDECGKRFTWPGNLAVHERTHLSANDPRRKKPTKLECQECGKLLAGNRSLRLHMQTHMAADDPRKQKWKCDICGKALCGKQALRNHQQTHLDDNDPDQAALKRPFNCELCGGFYRTRQSHRRHMKKHARDKNFGDRRWKITEKLNNIKGKCDQQTAQKDGKGGANEEEEDSTDDEGEERGAWPDDESNEEDDEIAT